MSCKDTQRHRWLKRVLRSWYAEHRRDFLWRREPRNPYVVLVAEVMLQQTQVWRAEPALARFLERFPTLDALAHATKADVLRSWEGLGYNRRAVQLHATARIIMETWGGRIPSDYQLLRTLPGIGDYTARAICAFAFGQDVAVVDINVRRVLSRFLVVQPTEADLLPLSVVVNLASDALPSGGARWWNEALMDVGALFCARQAPQCAACPLQSRCASAGTMQPARVQKKQEPTHRGIPRRIWRGKLLALLRHQRQLTFEECAQALWIQPTAEDLCWLEQVALQLEREGLICRNADGSITLPMD